MTPDFRATVRDHVLSVLQIAELPCSQVDLAWSVKHNLAPEWGLETCRRRVKESVAHLVRQGHPIVTDRHGYRLDTSPEGVAAGRRFIVRQLASLAQRLRAFDKAAAGDVEQLVLRLDARP